MTPSGDPSVSPTLAYRVDTNIDNGDASHTDLDNGPDMSMPFFLSLLLP